MDILNVMRHASDILFMLNADDVAQELDQAIEYIEKQEPFAIAVRYKDPIGLWNCYHDKNVWIIITFIAGFCLWICYEMIAQKRDKR